MDPSIYKQAKEFLDPLYENIPSFPERPFITLTFAQSLDGKISKKGQQILISGKESLAMTHRLRSLHDGIMVGIGTALIDNPQLNARFLLEADNASQPQPIVLDPFLKIPVDCKLIKNYIERKGRQLWLVTSREGCAQSQEKKLQLEKLQVNIVVVDETQQGRIPLKDVFRVLKERGINTLMIEGGAQIIQSSLKNEWDQLIITTGPLFIGSDGIPAIEDIQDLRLTDIKYGVFGRDSVMSSKRAK